MDMDTDSRTAARRMVTIFLIYLSVSIASRLVRGALTDRPVENQPSNRPVVSASQLEFEKPRCWPYGRGGAQVSSTRL